MSMPRTRLLSVALAIAWLAVLAAGQHSLLEYQSAPGPAADAPARWPPDSSLRPQPGQFTLLLFAHPHCPCTRASLEELAWITARAEGKVDTCVLFVRPRGAPEGWEAGGSWSAAAAIPGVRTLVDEGGQEARRFDADTSGQVLLYDPRGRLAFGGGITAGRGHQGDNAGRRAVLDLLAGAPPAGGHAPVFGCPLIDDYPPCVEGGPACTP
jgi:hypothetical protein